MTPYHTVEYTYTLMFANLLIIAKRRKTLLDTYGMAFPHTTREPEINKILISAHSNGLRVRQVVGQNLTSTRIARIARGYLTEGFPNRIPLCTRNPRAPRAIGARPSPLRGLG